MSKRLEILQASLAKKQEKFDNKISEHFADVKSANGQPMNDKSNGNATMSRWEKQNNALRSMQDGIEKTKAAIEREKYKIKHVESVTLPEFILKMVESNELIQWRKHPHIFFVAGVDKGRIVWDEEQQTVLHKYVRDIPKEQYPMFRDAFNKANGLARQLREGEKQ